MRRRKNLSVWGRLPIAAVVALALLAAVEFPNAHAEDGSPEAAIRKVLKDQVAAWNRGDVVEFMQGYKQADDTTFVSTEVTHGYDGVLARYRRRYPTAAKMGMLDFTGLEVRLLGKGYAVVTGRFHLARTAEGGGDAEGIFSLILEQTQSGWKIILDHTRTTTP